MHRIFVSAVSKELKSYRTLVVQALQRRHYKPVFQEIFDLTDEEIIELLERQISSCDAMICLIGYRYGAEPSRPLDPFGRCSFTQFEYHFTSHLKGERRIPIFRFFTTPETPVDHPQDEDESLELLQEQFRNQVLLDRNWRSFSSHTELRAEIAELKFPWETASHRIKPNNLPAVGSLFVGREDFIESLRSFLSTDPSLKAAITAKQKIHGLGGVGKTRVAIEFAKRFSQDYSALLFLAADTPSTLEANLAGLCGALVLDLPEKDNANQEEQVAAAIRWLRRNSGWLLIIDNVDTMEAALEVEKLLSKLNTGHVLITSRLSDWGPSIEALDLDVVSEDAAKTILLMRTEGKRKSSESDPEDAFLLGKELGQLPLALEQAGAFIAKNACGFKEYHQRWRKHEVKIVKWHDPLQMKYPRSVATTWETTFDLLSESGRGVLNLLCWLAPDPIPCEMIFKLDAAEGESLIDAEDGIANLVEYSFLKRSEDQSSVSMHRLVQEIAHLRIEEFARIGWLRRSLRMVEAFCDGDPTDPNDWATIYTVAWPHTKRLIELADQYKIVEPTARLGLEFATYLKMRSDFSDSERLSRRSLRLREQEFGPMHPALSSPLNNLAILLQETNRFAEAEALLRRSIDIVENHFGPEHRRLIESLSNLAQLIQVGNRLCEAESLMYRALEIHEKVDNLDLEIKAALLGNLAQLLYAMNKLEEAEVLMRQSLGLVEEIYGKEAPKVAGWVSNLASLLQATNRFTEAEPLNRRSLAICEKAFGPDHPNVATAMSNLAELLKSTKRLVESEVLLRRSLEIDEVAYGPDHPTVALRLVNLSQLLHMTSRVGEAEALVRRALRINEESLGSEHPTVATDLSILALLLQDTERFSEAELLLRKALGIAEKAFGNDHREVAIQLNNLAQLYQSLNRFDEAEPLLRRSLEIEETNLHSEHLIAMTIRGNLALLLSNTNRREEAEALMRELLQLGEKLFGTESPFYGTQLNNLAQLVKESDRPDAAYSLSRQAFFVFELFRLRNGHEHPYYHLSRNNFMNNLQSRGCTEEKILEEIGSVQLEAKERLDLEDI